ncbi:molybdenum cofactor guanylyltransferase [Aquimarina pacifica]|uniref:molybdenum cofactor guanylyltransferase n=1 Tax=Aquimarina pacifica TaxID=1296415 RepID=UPI0004B11880|nr:molybdenum cofactor guanylyltransferase [Aquimarina pacifica]
MDNKKNRTAIILAGGKSSRMGSDKGLLLFKGIPFIQHIINAVAPLVNDIIIVSSNPNYSAFGLQRIEDIVPDSGPIGGLHAGLTRTKTENNLVISCDVPLVTSELLKKLIAHEKEDFDSIQFEAAGKTMPLIALYRKNCAAVCEKLLISGERRLRQLVLNVNTKTIQVSEKEQFLVANINTIEDLKAIKNGVEY